MTPEEIQDDYTAYIYEIIERDAYMLEYIRLHSPEVHEAANESYTRWKGNGRP